MSELRYACRVLAKSRAFALVTMVTLALAIGATTALFTLIKGTYFDGLPYPHAREIVTVSGEFAKSGDASGMPLSGPEFVALAEQTKALKNPTALLGASFNLTGEGDAVRFRGLRASASLFPMIGVPPLLGRVFNQEEQQPGADRVVVISYQLWQRALGGASDVIGRELQLILGQGFSMILFGLTIGGAGAFAAARVLHSLLFEVSATDPSAYCFVGLALGLATLCASYFPARAAMRLNPVEALRHE